MQTQKTDLARRETANLTENVVASVVKVLPPVDIYESEREILVVADLPGVPKEGLDVRFEGSDLFIEGTQTPPSRIPLPTYGFIRAFRVPSSVDPNGIRAELTQGVVRVHLAKAKASKPKRIEVKAT